jgi:hypothetical protein
MLFFILKGNLMIGNVTTAVLDRNFVYGYRSNRAYGAHWKYWTYRLHPSRSRLRNRLYPS